MAHDCRRNSRGGQFTQRGLNILWWQCFDIVKPAQLAQLSGFALEIERVEK
jgi:hypothetical protein